MSVTLIAVSLGAAVLLFWLVGAFQRLSALRRVIVQQFAPVDVQIQHRRELLLRWADDLRVARGLGARRENAWPPADFSLAQRHQPAPLGADDSHTHEALVAACNQLHAACDALRAMPARRGAASSVRVAEAALTDARARLQAVPPPPDRRISRDRQLLLDQLAAADQALSAARSQFNAATQMYNHATGQFPTWLMARVCGFRSAGSL
jgi:LemA protein